MNGWTPEKAQVAESSNSIVDTVGDDRDSRFCPRFSG